MTEKQRIERLHIDRRNSFDRRNKLISYGIENEGLEKRITTADRRISDERRSGWVRDTEWSSVCIDIF